jgi:hypothetical protein
MPAVFTGRWTRATIITQALERAGNLKVRQLARDRLNRILEELYSQWEWPFLYKVFPFTFPSGNTGGMVNIYPSFTLPGDFLKTEQEMTGLRIISLDGNTVDFPVTEVDPVQFRRRSIPHDLTGQRPLIAYFAYAEQICYFWPAPTQTCKSQLIYKFLPADVPIGSGAANDPVTAAYDADIPLFPWGGFLSIAIEQWALDYDENPRAQSKLQEMNSAFDNIRNIAMPRLSQEPNIPLDPTMFGPGFRDESSRYFRDWDWWGT